VLAVSRKLAPLALCALATAGCGDPDVSRDAGSLFDAQMAMPPGAPVLDPVDSPVPWPNATVRGRADARRVIVEGRGNPLATSILPDGTFCVDLPMPVPGTYDFTFFSQSPEGLLSTTGTTTQLVFDPAAPPVPGALTCAGTDPAGCSGETEICDNGRDDDCNGFVDLRDAACSSCTEDALEPNDDVDAPRVDPGRIADLRICPGNEDYYGVFARAGDTIDVRVLFVHANGDIDAQLLDTDRTTVVATSTTLDDDEVLSWMATSEGQHVVRVYAAGGASNGYVLDVDLTSSM
jgi:hypothetical protein